MAKTKGKQASFVIIDEAELSATEQDRLDTKRQKVTRAAKLARAQLLAASSKVTNRSPGLARWLCLHVHASREFAVQSVLTDAGVENLVPREKVVIVKRGQKIDVERAFIPGYVLVRCVLTPAAIVGLLRQRHVYDLVRGKDGYWFVPENEIFVLKAISSGKVPDMPVYKTFAERDKAKIVMGPFAGFKCTVLAVTYSRRPHGRLLIDLGGQSFEIDSHPLAFLQKL